MSENCGNTNDLKIPLLEACIMIMLFKMNVNIRGTAVAPMGCVLNQQPEVRLQVLWAAYDFYS